MRTGLAQQDARDNFDRARRRATCVKLAGLLRGRPPSRNRLPVLGEVVIAGGIRTATEAMVPIDQIVGTVGGPGQVPAAETAICPASILPG